MKIYIDTNCCCYVSNDGTMREYDVEHFNDKCKTYIEGYRYVPQGETWTREDGTEFHGEMIAPWKDYSILAMAQEAYDEANSLLNIITEGVPSDDES